MAVLSGFYSGGAGRGGSYGQPGNLQDFICHYHAAFEIFDCDRIDYDLFK